MEYSELEKVNESLKKKNLKDKPDNNAPRGYVMVNERIKAFRQLFPNGQIETEMVSNQNGVCVFNATIADGDGNFLANAHAYEKENSTYINKTSFIENCETSAVGRALGFLGIGIDESVASFEEVANAKLNQDEAPKKVTFATEKQLEMIRGFGKSAIIPYMKKVKKTDITKLTVKEASAIISDLKARGVNNEVDN